MDLYYWWLDYDIRHLVVGLCRRGFASSACMAYVALFVALGGSKFSLAKTQFVSQSLQLVR